MPKHLALFVANEEEQNGEKKTIKNDPLMIYPASKSSTYEEETGIGEDNTVILQYWAAIIILSLFATVAFAVLLFTWKKIRPFSRLVPHASSLLPNFPENNASNDGNAATGHNPNAHRSNSDIIKSEPIASTEFLSFQT